MKSIVPPSHEEHRREFLRTTERRLNKRECNLNKYDLPIAGGTTDAEGWISLRPEQEILHADEYSDLKKEAVNLEQAKSAFAELRTTYKPVSTLS